VDSRDRITRPKPERTEPLRSWSALMGTSETGGNGGAASLDGVVSRSVEVGYRVVDEYLRHGQRVAERLGDRSLTPGNMAQDFQELTGRMTRYASDLMDVWFQLIELASARRPGAPEATAPAAAPAPPPPAEPAAGGTRVAVLMSSLQPTEVTVDVRPGALGPSLIVHALRAADADKPRLTEVGIEPAAADGTLRLRIRVPPDQPAGVYNGMIIDERTSRPVGTVSVRVGPGA
jgi:hypothetical protein